MTSNVTYIQCALLYTSSSGERRIRVHTMVVPVVSELADMYRWAWGADACGLGAYGWGAGAAQLPGASLQQLSAAAA